MLVAAHRPLGCAMLSLAVGCAHRNLAAPEVSAQRILPPPGAAAQAAPEVLLRPPERPREENKAGEAEKSAEPAAPAAGAAPGTLAQDGVPCQPLALTDAVALAFRLQPRLRASLESIA